MFKLLGCLLVISVFAFLMKASICNYITQLFIESQDQHKQLAQTNLLYLEQIEKRLDQLTQKWIPKPSAGDGNKPKR